MVLRCLVVLWLCIVHVACSVSIESDDPLTSLRIVAPGDGAVVVLPVVVRLGLQVTSTEAFEARYGDMHICVELNGVWKSCRTVEGPPVFDNLPEDNYTAQAFITDERNAGRSHETVEISFAVLSPGTFRLRTEKLLEQSREAQSFPEDIDIVKWAEHQQYSEASEKITQVLPLSGSPMVVIGIKTAVVTSFPRRQAIRETWASSATLPQDVKVLFLGCEPNVAVFPDSADRDRILRAVAKERTTYGDLLTEELECIDSYEQLSDKVRSFMHLTAAEFPHTKFVMLADDDIYLKVDQLADYLRDEAPRERLYLGEVWAAKYAHKQKPIREPASQYYLPEDKYPMSTLLPYASGPHYVVSMDCVRFVAKNYWRFRSMNGLEDVSTGIWMMQMQVHPLHVPAFSSIRDSAACDNDLISFADLSTLGIRSVHTNLLGNKSFCNGFHSVTWQRHANVLPGAAEMLLRSAPKSQLTRSF